MQACSLSLINIIFCIVDYHSKFPVIKKTEHLSADNLILMHEVIFAEYGLPKKIILDSGSNFVSGKIRTFCKILNIEQAFSLSYDHQSNGQVEACITFVKCTLKKCFDCKGDPHIDLLQILMTPLGPGFPRPATMLFNCLIGGVMPIINRPLVGRDNDEELYEVLIKWQTKDVKKPRYSPELCFYSIRVYCSGSIGRWRTIDQWYCRRKRQS